MDLCSSITESKHIKAVKDPWRRSSRHKAIGQMLVSNQRLDKLAASRVDFKKRGMLKGTCLSAAYHALHPDESAEEDSASDTETPNACESQAQTRDDDGAVPGPTVLAYVTMAATVQRQHNRSAVKLGHEIGQPRLPELISRFLYEQLNPESAVSGMHVPLTACPAFDEAISVFYSAAATYYAPSDPSGVGGMHRERIRATPLWWAQHHDLTAIWLHSFDDALISTSGRTALVFAFAAHLEKQFVSTYTELAPVFPNTRAMASPAICHLRDLSSLPDQFLHHIRRSVGTTISAVAFSNEGTSEKDMMDYIERQDYAHLKFSYAATPYACSVDFIPLRKLDPCPFSII
ncbi:hypothetical protein A0H81_12921 [Grifola frondosa]|uniref:Uncharacterized protein n=1 Tax=Grifola frondosa TaxID=5627 RepID=A0A1C7LWF3_GRIFR|nr:hypothetical protein A0H81_12921 [Grifola frondosa]